MTVHAPSSRILPPGFVEETKDVDTSGAMTVKGRIGNKIVAVGWRSSRQKKYDFYRSFSTVQARDQFINAWWSAITRKLGAKQDRKALQSHHD